MACAHCGEEHPPEAKFCPATGQPLAPPPAPSVPSWVSAPETSPSDSGSVAALVDPPARGIVELLQEAFRLYRRHARVLLITAAVLFVPGAVVSSCALTAVMAPLAASARATEEVGRRLAVAGEAMNRRLADGAKDGTLEPRELERLAREAERELAALPGHGAAVAGAMTGLTAAFLGLLGWAVTALILYGLVLPLTHGAVTIAVADRMLGGEATWREHWALLFRRMGALLGALVPAALLVMLGYFFLVLPGLVLSFLFSFVAPVVLIEGLTGTAALKRSVQLVRADWLRAALVLIAFGLLNVVAHFVAGLLIPDRAFFVERLLGDLALLVLLPVPIIGSLLLYFELRRKVDGVGGDRLREELEALRG